MELAPGDELLLLGPLGIGFSPPREAGARCSSAAASASRRWSSGATTLGGAETLLGFRDAAHAEGAALIPGARVATDDGSVGHHGFVTELLDRRRPHRDLRLRAAADARGDRARSACPGAARDGVRHGVRLRRLLRLRRPDRRRLRAPVRRRAGDRRREREISAASGSRTGSSTAPGRSTRSPPGACSATRCFEQFPFAAFVSKTVTLAPRQGNPPPRLWELAGGLINSIGLPNKGLEGYLRHDLPQLAELPVPLIVNVMGSAREDVARLVSAFAERDEVAALELNVSCPNVKTGLIMGADPRELAGLLDAVRPRTDKPLIVKLTPNCASPADVAAAAEQHGADAVSLINTLRGMALDPHRPGEPWLGGGTGGVSGSGRPRDRADPGPRGPRSASRCRSSAWEASRLDATRATSAPLAHNWSALVQNPSVTL